MNVIGNRVIYLVISAVLVVASLGVMVVKGFNFGVDFTGGSLLERGLPGAVSVPEVQEALAAPELSQYELGGSVIQPLEGAVEGQTVILIRTKAFEDQGPIAAIDEALEARFGEVSVRRTEVVGPVIGQELVRQAILALLIAGAGILVYISFRFEYRFGIAGVISLVQAVLITLGVVSLLGREINSPFVAAILTVVGYAINDTIVIFDRIRENLQIRRREPLMELVNVSIRQSLSRSINTGLTTLFVLVALYVFGGSSIKDFTLTLIVGVVVGAFSSIFVASPLWYVLRSIGEGREPARAAATSK